MMLWFVSYASGGEPLSFSYDQGHLVTQSKVGLRGHDVECESVSGKVHVYATFDMGPVNPLKFIDARPHWQNENNAPISEESLEVASSDIFYIQPEPAIRREANQPQNLQVLTLGEMSGETFTPAVRFGLADDGRAKVGEAHVTPWVNDGTIDYFSQYARPNTPYDFKLSLDLEQQRMTVWVSGRGGDDWFQIAEKVPLINAVKAINHVQVLQYPGAPTIREVQIVSAPIPTLEEVRSHPLKKIECTVGPNKGFRFQSMRSTWRKPGKHVTIFRRPGVHAGFPDVAQAGPNHLVCVWRKGSHTGGDRQSRLSHSYDLGKTWTDATPITTDTGKQLAGNCPRIQRLSDGKLLLLLDNPSTGDQFTARWDVSLYDSTDGGKTWTNERVASGDQTGGGIVPSHIAELADGSWLLAASSFPKRDGWTFEALTFSYSLDRGRTWKASPPPVIFPPRTLSEPSPVRLSGDRLVVYARESRYDGLPGVKYFSNDGGKTWELQELPHPITGRTCAKLLRDGRVMCTFRSGVGRAALRAWIGDPDDPTQSQPAGGHFNDRSSVGLKDGALHIDNDGMCGQFTKYTLRPPDTKDSTVEITAEVKVLSNQGKAATISIPFSGKLRIFSDHVEMAHNLSLRADVAPDQFHTYRVVSRLEQFQLYVDGKLAIDSEKGDNQSEKKLMGYHSIYALEFGNEASGSGAYHLHDARTMPDVYPVNITPEVSGYSIWRRVEVILNDPQTGRRELSWYADRDGFPDQYQLDHIIEIDASAAGHDQGYSGWTQLDDGRIFVVHYTDDGSAVSLPTPHNFGVPWIRGTFLEPSDLPPLKKDNS